PEIGGQEYLPPFILTDGGRWVGRGAPRGPAHPPRRRPGRRPALRSPRTPIEPAPVGRGAEDDRGRRWPIAGPLLARPKAARPSNPPPRTFRLRSSAACVGGRPGHASPIPPMDRNHRAGSILAAAARLCRVGIEPAS